MAEEPTVFMTCLDIQAMLRRKKEKASISLVCLDLKPPYLAEVARNLIPLLEG